MGEHPPGWVRDATPEEIVGSYWRDGVVPAGHAVGMWDATTHDLDWSVGGRGKRCRWTTGPIHRTCGQPAVVTLRRSPTPQGRAWGYCEQQEHLYGRVYEPGPPPRLLTPRLYETGDPA